MTTVVTTAVLTESRPAVVSSAATLPPIPVSAPTVASTTDPAGAETGPFTSSTPMSRVVRWTTCISTGVVIPTRTSAAAATDTGSHRTRADNRKSQDRRIALIRNRD